MRLLSPVSVEKVAYKQGWRGTIGRIVPTLFKTHPEHEFLFDYVLISFYQSNFTEGTK